MAIRLDSPLNLGALVDKNGNATPAFARWLTLLHAKTGGTEPALPVSLGGTGASTVVGAIAVQTGTTTGSGGSGAGAGTSATTQHKTFTLDSPPSFDLGDFVVTVCAWDTPFSSAIYQLTYEASLSHGSIDVFDQTAAGFSVRLTNLTQGRFAGGTLESIGVHA